MYKPVSSSDFKIALVLLLCCLCLENSPLRLHVIGIPCPTPLCCSLVLVPRLKILSLLIW
jgi:hypothetical protein